MPNFQRLVRFLAKDGRTYYGDAILPQGVSDISQARQARVIEGDIFGRHDVTDAVADIRLLLGPLAQEHVRSVRCLGLNYALHAKEAGMKIPEYPVLFYKPPTALAGPTDPIPIPALAQNLDGLDYECELVIVIGKKCTNVRESEALSYVLGYSVANDVSQREWQIKRGGGQWCLGKGFDGWAPWGPGIVSRDVIDPQNLKISTRLNGQTVQESNTADQIFNVKKTIAFLSQGTTLMPGDIILTGTPSGVGMGRSPQLWMKDGDVVEVELEGVGKCVNKVETATNLLNALHQKLAECPTVLAEMASTLVSSHPLAEQRRPDMDDIDSWVPPHGKAKSLDVVHLDEGYSSSINSLPGLSRTRSVPGDDSQDKDSVRDLDVGPVSDDLGEVDWTQYDPPDALFVVEDVESEIVSEIVGSSIENIRRQVRMMHDAVREVEEFESKGKQRAENVGPQAGHGPETQQPPSEWQNEPSLLTPDVQPAQEPRRWSGGFARRLLRHVQGSDKGESSAMGAVLGLVDRQSLERPASRGDTPQTTPGEASSSKPSFFAKLKKDKVVATVYVSLPDARPRPLFNHISTPPQLTSINAQKNNSECVSCFEDVPVKASVKTVCHSYCKECFARLVEAALDNEAQWPVKCCLNNVPTRTITKNVPGDLLRRYAAKAGEFATPVGDRLYCPAADCGRFVPRYSRSGSAAATAAAQCPAGHRICLLCRGEAHGGGGGGGTAACPGDADTRLANDLAAEEGWRRCPRCGVLVEHGEACQHMTCRCGGEFCYVCGAAWRSCACSMEDLRELKRRVAAQRVERESLASEEERGLREALALIEQLERDEEARAAEYRAELDRLAAESRRLERKERRLRERARRIAVAKKYRGERAALDSLASRQALLLRRGQADETARLAAQQA
ncbi:uncharacterized protein E0L32_011625, partial [Thyridium curvatum]